jgi:hypothetical protein
VKRALEVMRGLCFRFMYMRKEHVWKEERVVFPVHVHVKRARVDRREGCVSGSCTCEKGTWKEERVVFPVHVHVKRARGKERGFWFRFM